MIDKKKITKKPEQNIINSEWSSNDPEPWHKQKKKKKIIILVEIWLQTVTLYHRLYLKMWMV